MRVTRELPILAPPAALWELLWDVRRIVECVPGCVEAREIEPHQRYAARMTQKVGPISLSVPLDVLVVEADPCRRLAFSAKGRDPAIGAEIAMRVTLDIEARGDESLLEGLAEDDPRAPELALYAYLSWLQEQLVEALSAEF